jgi:magnesium chelatase family protein
MSIGRIDMQISVPALTSAELSNSPSEKNSDTIRARLVAARAICMVRQGKPHQALSKGDLDTLPAPSDAAHKLMRNAMDKLGWSERSYHRVLKVARTNANLAADEVIDATHVAEVLQYRRECLTKIADKTRKANTPQ